MSLHKHAVVWIDHESAHIVGFDERSAQFTLLYADGGPRHLYHEANRDSDRPSEHQIFLRRTGMTINRFDAILVTGPASEKHELKEHLERYDPATARRIVAVLSLAHPTDRQLLAHGRKFFASLYGGEGTHR